jgi:translation initiation factor 2 beta subunit (eIF-2beta)/eIF-5
MDLLNYREALDEFNYLLLMTDPNEDYYNELLCAVTAIEKQIPKVIQYGDLYATCPTCGDTLTNLKYCGNCGQKLTLPIEFD